MADLNATTCFAAIAQHQKDLPPGAVARWALLVSLEELNGLMDEFAAQPSYGLVFDPLHAQHIREGRAVLIINGTPVIPELMESPASRARPDG